MARVAGVDLPPNKRAEIGLTYIYGIGRSRSASILNEAQVNLDTRVRDLNEDELSRIRAILESQGEIEGEAGKTGEAGRKAETRKEGSQAKAVDACRGVRSFRPVPQGEP